MPVKYESEEFWVHHSKNLQKSLFSRRKTFMPALVCHIVPMMTDFAVSEQRAIIRVSRFIFFHCKTLKAPIVIDARFVTSSYELPGLLLDGWMWENLALSAW